MDTPPEAKFTQIADFSEGKLTCMHVYYDADGDAETSVDYTWIDKDGTVSVVCERMLCMHECRCILLSLFMRVM